MSGEDIGFIRFGSRVDIFVPADFLVLVSEGDRVGSGRTLLARKKTGGEIGMPADSGPSKSPPVCGGLARSWFAALRCSPGFIKALQNSPLYGDAER